VAKKRTDQFAQNKNFLKICKGLNAAKTDSESGSEKIKDRPEGVFR
jgi:hypothetical protein